ncbi:MAG: recombination protein O N-terminal domain-containing protein [Deltaproteobacteria bacterium]|jgi:DNA repair protein RecO (recombination protein O)|nr:recombination protein O N-terminal domain-containing protein [Deltaproteobacteria bacterium]
MASTVKRRHSPLPPPERLGGIVLGRADSGEADLVVTFLTRERGLVSAVAKNAKKSVKRFGGGMLSPGRAAFYLLRMREDREVGFVENSEPNPKAPVLPDLPLVQSLAAKALELARAFEARRNPAPESFDLLVRHISDLSSPPPTEPPALEARTLSLSFAKHYLALAGFGVSFGSCRHCGRVPAPGETWRWEKREAGVVCPDCLGKMTEVSPPVPAGLLAKLDRLPPPMRRMKPFSETELGLAENYFETLASIQAGRRFRSGDVTRALLKSGREGPAAPVAPATPKPAGENDAPEETREETREATREEN